MSCSLCAVAAAPDAVPLHVGASEFAVVVLHDDWSVRGHAMVVARAHVENSADLSDVAAAGFFDTLRRAERALLDVLPVERVFVMKLGVAVPHLHYHLYPMSRSASRDDFLRAVLTESRDEPEDEAKQQLLATLRERFA